MLSIIPRADTWSQDPSALGQAPCLSPAGLVVPSSLCLNRALLTGLNDPKQIMQKNPKALFPAAEAFCPERGGEYGVCLVVQWI